MTRRSLSFAFVAVLLAGAMAAAQAHAPVVTMSVTTPDGRTHELTAAESGLATLTLKDGTEYGFRPTIQDSSPWNRARRLTRQRQFSGKLSSEEADRRWIRKRIRPSRCLFPRCPLQQRRLSRS